MALTVLSLAARRGLRKVEMHAVTRAPLPVRSRSAGECAAARGRAQLPH